MLEVARAGMNDIEQLVLLLEMLFSQEEEFSFDADKHRRGLSLILENEDIGTILVLKENNKILGMVNLLFTISTALGGKAALLEDMVIDKNHRRKGYGKMLLRQAIAYAKERGCLRITLLTDKINTAAVVFYKAEGFKDSTMIPLRLIFKEK